MTQHTRINGDLGCYYVFTVILEQLNLCKQTFNIVTLICLIKSHKQHRKAVPMHCFCLFCLFSEMEDQLVQQNKPQFVNLFIIGL